MPVTEGGVMQMRLRVIVPTIQMTAFVATLALKKLSTSNDRVNFNYYEPARSIVEALNYPLMAFWLSLDHLLGWFHVPNLNGGSASTGMVLVAGFAFFVSVILFWYFVVKESELRLQGKSVLRFSGRIGSFFAPVVLFCLGVGAPVSAYIDARMKIPIMLRNGSHIGLFLTVLPDMILLAWALALTGISVSDFRSLEWLRSSDRLSSR
jgi:hypothetical protein